MKSVTYDRGRIIDCPPEVVACLWSNWEIYDSILNRKFKVHKTRDKHWTADSYFKASLTLESKEASLVAGRFIYAFHATIAGLPSATVVTLRYESLTSGKTSVHGQFKSDLVGVTSLMEPFVRGRINKAIDAVIAGGQTSCELIAHEYDSLKARLPKEHLDEIDLYLTTGQKLRRGLPVDSQILSGPPSDRREEDPESKRIFIVHGRNEQYKTAAADLLKKYGFDPIILSEQPNSGRTLIEKFELHANADYAVVLLTPDDRGGLFTAKKYQGRARQNVVFEMGYFIGRLTRKRVCALYREGVELPSDVTGIMYIPLDDGGVWKRQLMEELKAMGFEIREVDDSQPGEVIN